MQYLTTWTVLILRSAVLPGALSTCEMKTNDKDAAGNGDGIAPENPPASGDMTPLDGEQFHGGSKGGCEDRSGRDGAP